MVTREVCDVFGDEVRSVVLYGSVARGEAIPGVRSATVANQMPIAGGHARSTVIPPGREDLAFEAEYVVVGPGYFETMGIPVHEGRALGAAGPEAERVVVVNRALADRFWPGESAVGKELIRGESDPWRVVGVAGDVQMRTLRSRPNPAVYYPLAQEFDAFAILHLAAEPGASPSPEVVRRAVAQVDPELPVARVIDLQQAVAASMDESRTIGYLVAAFAGLALLLSAVGLYGVGLGRGLGIAVTGIVVGFGVSYALGSALESLLFGVRPGDLVVLGGGAAFLLATASLAAWLPARRASRVDAAVTLREGG